MTAVGDVNDYDTWASAYSVDNEQNVYNAHYERPATLNLVGRVSGLRVLDAGCGSGAHAEALIRRGAEVIGLDSSQGLLEIARRRLGSEVPLVHANLEEPLPLPSGRFDIVVAALVMHYLRDWAVPLAEFHRLLKPDGRVVISTHHPFMDVVLAGRDDYLGTYEFADEWERDGKRMSMRFWHRPLHAMVDAFTESRFLVEKIAEPRPLDSAAELSEAEFQRLNRQPHFLFFSLRKIDKCSSG
jgi:ubiquinone/menaquinone biosynthesis C-methylase UbiE